MMSCGVVVECCEGFSTWHSYAKQPAPLNEGARGSMSYVSFILAADRVNNILRFASTYQHN